MQKYINQLLTDLKTAQSNQPEKVDYKLLHPDHPAASPEYGDALTHIIEWEHAPEVKMDDLFGIKASAFPPSEQLTEAQAKDLVIAIIELWGCFNIAADVNDAPPRLVYSILVNYWKNETVQYISEGTLHLEYCHYDTNDCPWGSEYCTCKEFEDNEIDSKDSHAYNNDDNFNLDLTDLDSDNLPF